MEVAAAAAVEPEAEAEAKAARAAAAIVLAGLFARVGSVWLRVGQVSRVELAQPNSVLLGSVTLKARAC